MGGGGFTMGERNPALDRLVLQLTGKRVPKICFLPTASGDPREQVLRFHERYEAWPCEPTVLSLFHLGRDRIDPARHLLAQDAIYVGGGSMRNMLAIWREHGLDRVMRSAWKMGIVMAGLSAGAMCWFQGGISMSGGRPEVVDGCGLLPGSLSVHRDGEAERLPVYLEAVGQGALAEGWAVDDCAALVFAGTTLAACVSSRPGAGVVRVERFAGGVMQRRVDVHLLRDEAGRDVPLLSRASEEERAAVSEMRALRAGARLRRG
jgi:dipeptidase E